MKSRRSFLKFVGVGSAAAVSAAQRLQENLSGLATVGANSIDNYAATPVSSGSSSGVIHGILKKFGVPLFKERELRRESKYRRILDPDIAALHSVSTQHKLKMQYEINYQRLKTDYLEGYSNNDERQKFLQKHGIDWI